MKKYTYLTLIILIGLFNGNMIAQNLDNENEPEYLQLMNDPGDVPFSVIQQKAEEYFSNFGEIEEQGVENKEEGWESDYTRWKRWEYYNERRLTPDGKVTNPEMMNWQAYKEYAGFDGIQKPKPNPPDPSDATNGSWYFLAPTSWINGTSGYNPGIGRINCIAFHPSNANILYVGAPSGGMWKTTNGGSSWTNLSDGLPAIGVSGIVVHPTNANIIYILTGDGDGGDTKSIGVLKSTNGGTTWAETGLSWDITSNVRGYKLKMHPTNSNILFITSNNGIYKTTNAGSTWTQIISGTFYDIEFNSGNSTIMYATKSSSFYRSTNTGDSFTFITSVPGATRTEIGVTPANSNYVYLFSGPATGVGSFVGLRRSFDGGLTFGTQSTTPNILGYSSTGNDNKHQTTYDLAIVVSRTSTGSMITGGINTWRSTNYGVSWSLTSMWNTPSGDYTHADIHALEINPLNNYVYCGSDGGIFRSTDFGNTWSDLSSGLSTTQWYRIAGYEANSSLIIGGTQDNGCNKWSGGSSYTHIWGADGMDAMIDHTNSNIMYFSEQDGGLRKSTNGGSTSFGIKPSGATGAWVTPYVMNPVTATTIYGGYNDVYKSTNGGSSWTNQGVDGRGAMALGTSYTGRVYASSGSSIWRSDDAAATWTSISSGLPAATITFIAVNPDNSLDVFVTIAGFNDGQKVYASYNGGGTWTNITGSLPNIIVNCIAYEDNNASPDDALYIGTDIGVFYRDNSLGDWIPFSNWLPTVPVFDLEINYSANVLTAGTYGRGLWRSPLYDDCVLSWSLSSTAGPGYSYYQASNSISSSRVFNAGVGQEGYFKAGNSITLTTGFQVAGGSRFKAWLGPCGPGIPENEPQVVIESEENPLPVPVVSNQ